MYFRLDQLDGLERGLSEGKILDTLENYLMMGMIISQVLHLKLVRERLQKWSYITIIESGGMVSLGDLTLKVSVFT